MPIAGQTLEHSYLRLLWGSLQPPMKSCGFD
jgi:hypothetical protein